MSKRDGVGLGFGFGCGLLLFFFVLCTGLMTVGALAIGAIASAMH